MPQTINYFRTPSELSMYVELRRAYMETFDETSSVDFAKAVDDGLFDNFNRWNDQFDRHEGTIGGIVQSLPYELKLGLIRASPAVIIQWKFKAWLERRLPEPFWYRDRDTHDLFARTAELFRDTMHDNKENKEKAKVILKHLEDIMMGDVCDLYFSKFFGLALKLRRFTTHARDTRLKNLLFECALVLEEVGAKEISKLAEAEAEYTKNKNSGGTGGNGALGLFLGMAMMAFGTTSPARAEEMPTHSPEIHVSHHMPASSNHQAHRSYRRHPDHNHHKNPLTAGLRHQTRTEATLWMADTTVIPALKSVNFFLETVI